MRRRIVVYSTVLLLLSVSLVVALECDTVPTCEYQGFTMSVSDCVGKNTLRCPREPDNDNAVYCGGNCQTKLAFDPLWDGRSNTTKMLAVNNGAGSGFSGGSGSGSGSGSDYGSGSGSEGSGSGSGSDYGSGSSSNNGGLTPVNQNCIYSDCLADDQECNGSGLYECYGMGSYDQLCQALGQEGSGCTATQVCTRFPSFCKNQGYAIWNYVCSETDNCAPTNIPYAATAARNYFAISEYDSIFGRRKWYLPALGELAEAYGINYSDVTQATGKTGATGVNKTKINTALTAIGPSDATVLSGSLWSSTEKYSNAWYINMNDGRRASAAKSTKMAVRPFLLLKDKFETAQAPAVGSIVYADLTHSTAAGYDSSKTPVGVVVWVSPSGRSAKIVSLKSLSSNYWNNNSNNILALADYSDAKVVSSFTNIKGDFCKETNNCLGASQTSISGEPCTDCNLTAQQKCNRWGGAWCDEWDCIQAGGTWESYDEPNGVCRMDAPGSSYGSGANLCALYGGHYCSGSGYGSGYGY